MRSCLESKTRNLLESPVLIAGGLIAPMTSELRPQHGVLRSNGAGIFIQRHRSRRLAVSKENNFDREIITARCELHFP
jgi:hypothetical protein